MKKVIWLLAIMLPLCLWGIAQGQTPDGMTPAEEEACTKYEGEGARHGLCIAYCEAQDCVNYKDDPSCQRIRENFIHYSKKKGYLSGKKKPEKNVIDCSVTACSYEDRNYCKGKEIDCYIDKECTAICTSTFQGFTDKGEVLCTKAPLCKKCVKDPECDYIACEVEP
ncbi:MAG: hypothetical protein JRF02_09810 [Deltaproteobacteria bacterium]|nr:hypothetical protein [Deltaproteobacteria bacterium]